MLLIKNHENGPQRIVADKRSYKQSLISVLDVVRVSALIILAVWGFVQNRSIAAEIDPEALTKFEEYLTNTDGLERWCRWTLITPTASMYDSGQTSSSGVSAVNMVWSRGDYYDLQYIVIENFRDLFNLKIATQARNFDDGQNSRP